MKILTVIGARPQFIKAASISRILKEESNNDITEIIVHTGQHYNHNMSEQFFYELDIPLPKYNLAVGSGSHGQQTGNILVELEKIFEIENPDWLLVYGDTNTTLASALVAAKVPCKIAHIEAGLRSNRWGMPEEVNRIVTDRLSDLLFCVTESSKKNLFIEGRTKGVFVSGDVMYDSFLYYMNDAIKQCVLTKYKLRSKIYILVTIHRAENVDDLNRLDVILSALRELSHDIDVILPLHPRTKKMIEKSSFSTNGIHIVEPISYLDMISLLVNSRLVVTDSGGLQKEAYFAKVLCITLRDETEWIETVDDGWNKLVPPVDHYNIVSSIKKSLHVDVNSLAYHTNYGDGNAAQKIVEILKEYL